MITKCVRKRDGISVEWRQLIKGGGARRLDERGHLGKEGGGSGAIIHDEYDHWEFHNFIRLLDYICPQITFFFFFFR